MNYNYDKSPKNRRLSSPKPAPFRLTLMFPNAQCRKHNLVTFPLLICYFTTSRPKPAPFVAQTGAFPTSHLDVPERPVQEAQLSNFPIIDLLLYDKSPKTGAFPSSHLDVPKRPVQEAQLCTFPLLICYITISHPNRRLSVLSP